MESTKNAAYESLTTDQALKLFRDFVSDRVDREKSVSFQMAAKAGICEALLEMLIIKDPLDVLDKLHIARTLFEVVEYDNADDLTGSLIGLYHSETLADEIVRMKKAINPDKMYVITKKIHVL